MAINYYQILEIDEKATEEEIRIAFRKKAKEFHPDLNKQPEAQQKFRLVYMAYEILGDDLKRKVYDYLLQKKRENGDVPCEEGDCISRWADVAQSRAHQYEQMRYEYVKNTTLSGFDFHFRQALWLGGFSLIGSLGILLFVLGFLAAFNKEGWWVFGVLALFFGSLLTFYAIRTVFYVVKSWALYFARRKKESSHLFST
jgi:curved DNA-binding protein CbpA